MNQPQPNQLNQNAPAGTQVAATAQSIPEMLGGLIPLRNPIVTGGTARPYYLGLPTQTMTNTGPMSVDLETAGLGYGLAVLVTGQFVATLAASTSLGQNGGGIVLSPDFPYSVLSDIMFQPSGGDILTEGNGWLMRQEMIRMLGKWRDPNRMTAPANCFGGSTTGVMTSLYSVAATVGGSPVTLSTTAPYYNTTTSPVNITVNFSFFLIIPWVDNFVELNGILPLNVQNATFPVKFIIPALVGGNALSPAYFVSGADITGSSSIVSQSVSIAPTQMGVTVPNNASLYTGLAAVRVTRFSRTNIPIGSGPLGLQVYFDQGYQYLAATVDIRLNFLPTSGDIASMYLMVGPKTPVEQRYLWDYIAKYAALHGAYPDQGIFQWDGLGTGWIPNEADDFGTINAQPGGIVRPNVAFDVNTSATFGTAANSNFANALFVASVKIG
jgi:hypothetical protein